MAGRRFLLACFLLLLGACNMVVSETPMFAESDAANITPRPGIWLAEVPDCDFDPSLAEAQWPECAMWLIVKTPGKIMLSDGKGQSQEARYVITRGQPTLVQMLWRDDAKDDGKTFYVFFGLEPDRSNGEFAAASSWEVKCGPRKDDGTIGGGIDPYPGISPECRPKTQDAIRAAAVASRSTAEMAMTWRWLRPASN